MPAIHSYFQVFQSRKMTALLLLGFASGLPLFLTSRTLQLWMQDAKVDLGAITLFGLVSLPYSLKFLWAPFLDRFLPPWLGPRRGWLLLTQIGLVLAIVAIALQNPAQDVRILQILAITTLAIAFLSATQDIAGDAYRTDVLAEKELESGASLWVLGYRIALFITSFLALALADFIPWNAVYLIMAGFMAIGIFATLWAPEPPRRSASTAKMPTAKEFGVVLFLVTLIAVLFAGAATERLSLTAFYAIVTAVLMGWIVLTFVLPRRSSQATPTDEAQSLQAAVVRPFQEFFERFGVRQAGLILLFIVLYKLGDSLVGIAGSLFLRELGFSKTDLAGLQGVIGLIATSTGVLVGGLIMTRTGINRALWIFGIFQLLSNLGYWLLAGTGKNYGVAAQVISIENFCAGLVTVATVAFLMSLCNHDYTTTQFALFSSLMAIGRDVLSAPSGELAKATGWSAFFLWSVVAALPGLFLLPLVAPWRSQPQPLPRPGLEEDE
jgi:PAT family beta-lactamase induction signal transducer AmpG